MSMTEAQFDKEQELQEWVVENIERFLPGVILLSGFRINTSSGKGGVPDCFAFDLVDHKWYVIENELLTHGVWTHITEQVVRYVVALKNSETRRKVRDQLFDHIAETNCVERVSALLEVKPEQLLRQIELFIEGVQPELVIFIDDTNQDLIDMAEALDVTTRIFRVCKFVVNGKPEYYSPDHHAPSIVTEPDEKIISSLSDFNIIEILGGGQLEASAKRFKCYRLEDNSIVHIKRSKYHEKNGYYWYGISLIALESINEYNVTHIIFVMGDEGFVKVPIDKVSQFLDVTKVSTNEDGTVRHYHCLISPGPNPELYWSNEVLRFSLADYYIPFN